MAKYSGKNLYVSFGGNDLDGTFRTFEVSEAQNQAEATAGDDDYQNYVNTNKSLEASMTILMHTHGDGGSALMNNIGQVGEQGTLLWGAEGSATGMPKGGFVATLTTRDRTIPYDDVVEWSLAWSMAQSTVLFDDETDLWP